MSMRLREFSVQIENLSLKEVPGRLAAYLLYLSKDQARKKHSEVNHVALTISKGQLASLLGTIPETLSRIFAKMNQQNLISVKGKHIHLRDMAGLKDLAETGKLLE